jgi:hypothetical protein
LFELGEEAFDTPSLLVGDTVLAALELVVAAGRNERFAEHLGKITPR